MKTLNVIANSAKMVLAATTMTMAMTSCLGDGDTSYAYISAVSSDCYANSDNAFAFFQSLQIHSRIETIDKTINKQEIGVVTKPEI